MATIEDIVKVCDIVPAIDSFSNFVETGTGEGDSVQYILEGGCSNIWSVEIHTELYTKVKQRFAKYSNCHIINNDSVSALYKIVPELIGDTLFFLDAHFPGADFHYSDYDDIKKRSIRIPLKDELEEICIRRNLSKYKDVFIIDDLRIYENGPYEMGNWEQRKELGCDSIDFIYDYLGETHVIHKYFNYTGFIIAIPKKG